MNNFTFLITKPGLGSIKDSIKFKILPIFYFKKSNYEYLENLKNFKIIKELIKDNYSNENKLIKIFDKINFQTYRGILNDFNKNKFDGNQIFWNLLKSYEKK